MNDWNSWDMHNEFLSGAMDSHLAQKDFEGVRQLTDVGRAAGALPLPVEAGTKVVFAGTLGAHLTYDDVPAESSQGDVVNVKSANGDITHHDGKVFVKWDDGKFRPIHAEHLRLAGCEKLPEGPMRDNCEKKKEEGKEDEESSKKAKKKLPEELEKHQFTSEDNPNPKGNDKDGDGETNEPSPIKGKKAMEHATKDALKEYLKEHPDADKSKHTVGGGAKPSGEAKGEAAGAVFEALPVRDQLKWGVKPKDIENLVSSGKTVEEFVAGLLEKELKNNPDDDAAVKKQFVQFRKDLGLVGDPEKEKEGEKAKNLEKTRKEMSGALQDAGTPKALDAVKDITDPSEGGKLDPDDIWTEVVQHGKAYGFGIDDMISSASTPKEVGETFRKKVTGPESDWASWLDQMPKGDKEKLLGALESSLVAALSGSKKGSFSGEAERKRKKSSAKEKYPWDDCIADQMKEYGDKETAEKVCGAIKYKSQGKKAALIRLAAKMEKGSEERRTVLRMAKKLPEELEKHQFTSEDNPNPKGNDKDGDGKTNEPSPIKGKKAALIRLASTYPAGSQQRIALLKLIAGCEKLPEGPMRDNCEKKKEEGEEAKDKESKKSSMRVASLGDLTNFLKIAEGVLIHKSTNDLWSFAKDADGFVVSRLFDDTGEPLKG